MYSGCLPRGGSAAVASCPPAPSTSTSASSWPQASVPLRSHNRVMLTRTPAGGHPLLRNNLLRTTPSSASSSSSRISCSAASTHGPRTAIGARRRSSVPDLRALDPKQPSPPNQPAVQWGRPKLKANPRPGFTSELGLEADSAKGKLGPVQEAEPEPSSWGLLDPARLDYTWPVPWGPGTLAGGMVLWLLSFVGTGFILVPAIYKQAGIDIYELSSQDKAIFTCVCQLAETVVTLALIRTVTVKSMNAAPAEARSTLFNYSPSQPFSKPRGWAVWAALGTCLAPAVVGSVGGLLSLTGYEEAVGGRGTVDGVAAMITIDWPTYLSLLSVTGVLAPILEETVFRGFLLTSLTRFMPTWAAIPSSSLIFGLAHLSPKDFPVLFSLGCLLGVLYTRSRNLLTPIIVHGAWNSAVLTLLFGLAAFGINIQELIGAVDDLPAS